MTAEIYFPEGTSEAEKTSARRACARVWPEAYSAIEFYVDTEATLVDLDERPLFDCVRYSYARLHCNRCQHEWRVWTRADSPADAQAILGRLDPRVQAVPAFDCPRCHVHGVAMIARPWALRMFERK